MIKKIFIAIFCICLTQNAYATTDLPLGHWIYEALEKLAILGVTDVIGLHTRPLSRVAVAHRIAGIIEDVQNEKLTFSALRDEVAMDKSEDLLYKLMDEFEGELAGMGVEVVMKTDEPLRRVSFKLFDQIRKEVIYTNFDDSTKKSIKLENRRGWESNDGINGRVSLDSWISLKDYIGLRAESAYYGSKDKSKLTLDEAFLKTAIYNIEGGVGRTSMWWGPGRHGAMLLSNNTRPLYTANITNQRPFALPYLEKLGLWNVNFFTSKFINEESRAIKEPYLSGLRVEYSPHRRLSLGLNHTVMWGGEGVPHVSAVDLLDMFFSKLGGGAGEPENHLVSFTGEWAVPALNTVIPLASGALIYCEIGAEDEDRGMPSRVGGLGGVRITDLLMMEDLDLIFEYAKTDSSWYTHSVYLNGYTHRGNVLGHHLGTDGDDIFVGLSKDFGELFNAGIWFDGERHGLSSAIVERKYEGGVNFTYRYFKNVILQANYELEYFQGYGHVSKQTTKNHIVTLGGRLDF